MWTKTPILRTSEACSHTVILCKVVAAPFPTCYLISSIVISLLYNCSMNKTFSRHLSYGSNMDLSLIYGLSTRSGGFTGRTSASMLPRRTGPNALFVSRGRFVQHQGPSSLVIHTFIYPKNRSKIHVKDYLPRIFPQAYGVMY